MAALAVAPRVAVYDRAAIYSRVSTLMQAQHGFPLAAQAKDCRRYADELGATVVGEYTDQDSGAEWDLPQLNAMLDAAKRHAFDVLIVYDPDRLARSMAKQLVLEEELKRYGVSIQYVGLRLGDSAEDRLLKNVRASIAEYEREKTRMRSQRGQREKAERGQVVGAGPAAYGYRYTLNAQGRRCGLEPNPLTADVVRRIFTQLLTMSTADVAASLEADGIPAPRGRGAWHPFTVQGIAINTVYVGVWVFGRRRQRLAPDAEGSFVKVPVPPIIDRGTWDAVQRALRHRRTARRGRIPASEDAWELRGMLLCDHCGGQLATHTNNGYRYYICLRGRLVNTRLFHTPLCDFRSVLAASENSREEALETHVWQRLCAALLDPERLQAGLAAARAEHDTADQERQARLQTLDREMQAMRARLEKIALQRLDAEAGGDLDTVLLKAIRETEAGLRSLQSAHAELAALRPAGLSAAEALSLETFVTEVCAGMRHATPAERRRFYQLLSLRLRVRRDPSGVRLGQRYRYAFDWEARIPLGDSAMPSFEIPVTYTRCGSTAWLSATRSSSRARNPTSSIPARRASPQHSPTFHVRPTPSGYTARNPPRSACPSNPVCRAAPAPFPSPPCRTSTTGAGRAGSSDPGW
jgi:site-specific DNA recombinase